MKKAVLLFIVTFLCSLHGLFAQQSSGVYRVVKTMTIGGAGGWDYLAVDQERNRLFVSHGTCVEVLDLKTGKPAGKIPGTPGVHGIAIVPSLGKGFITAGRIDSVIVFDLKTLEVKGKIKTGQGPDFILYDAFSKRIFTFNSRGHSITAIDAKTGKVAGTLEVSGKPEAAVSNGIGKIYCNIEDQSTVVRFDALALEIEAEWPLEPGKEPTGLAIDTKTNRLFSACSASNLVVVLDAVNGNRIATLPIGEECDGIIFIPASRHIITSNGEGTMTIIRQDGPDSYQAVQTLETMKGARTMTYDETTNSIYLPAAEVAISNGKRKVVSGSFKVMVVSR